MPVADILPASALAAEALAAAVLARKNQLSRAARKSIRARSFKGTWVRLG
jgi:hypothetical protein